MIGNVIQSKFLVLTDYPQAAALSFILMAAILVLVLDLRAGAGHRAADGMTAHGARRPAAARRAAFARGTC